MELIRDVGLGVFSGCMVIVDIIRGVFWSLGFCRRGFCFGVVIIKVEENSSFNKELNLLY